MKGYIKKKFIEYKIYKKGRVCHKDSICKNYPDGALLIYKDEPEQIRVVCKIKTDFENVRQIINEIMSIELPESEDAYNCLSVLPVEGYMSDSAKVRFVVNSYIIDSEDEYETRVISQFSDDGHKEFYICINVKFLFEANAFIRYDPQIAHLVTGFKTHQPLSDQIKKWCNRTSFNQFKQAIESRVKGQANLRMVLVNVYQYLHVIAKGKSPAKLSMILIGPSGCGKTETMRSLKDYFAKEIPGFVVSLIDMNQITSEGFKGKDTNYLVSGLKAGHSDGIGIVFLDEFDKRLVPAYDGGGANVNDEVQHQLLEAIEGYVFEDDDRTVDTSKTMFIGMGSFDVVRKNRKDEAANTNRFGFGAAATKSEHNIDHYEEVTREDMIKIGACYELIGRFGQVVNYGALSYEAIDNIIDMRVKSVSDTAAVKVSISREMRAYLHENSNTEYGNRLIDSLLRETVNAACADMLEKEIDASEIIVTGKQQYQIIKRRSSKR